MRWTTIERTGTKIKISKKLEEHSWFTINYDLGWERWYHYTDEEYLSSNRGRMERLGIPATHRYGISFERVPKGKKRLQMISLYFGDDGYYTGIIAYCVMTKKELREHEKQAIKELLDNGSLMEDE